MLPADGPSPGSQHGRQPTDGLWFHPELGDANRQSGRVLDVDVLDVDACLARRVEQPGQLAGAVRDDYLRESEARGRAAALAGEPGHPGRAAFEQLGQFLAGQLLPRLSALERPRRLLKISGN